MDLQNFIGKPIDASSYVQMVNLASISLNIGYQSSNMLYDLKANVTVKQ